MQGEDGNLTIVFEDGMESRSRVLRMKKQVG
jgi:hypothetical protein